jgi:transcriptional regulator with XRE-family HTH domain
MESNESVVKQRQELGEKLTQFRKKQNLTQEDVAQQLGVTKSSINKMEKGVWMSLEMLIKLSEILNFKVDLLEK